MTDSDAAKVDIHGVNKNRRPGTKRAEVIARRKLVAEYYLQHATESEIAQMLGVGQATISRDIQAILADWKRAYLVDAEAYVLRDLADLDSLERECATRLRATGEAIWVLRLVQIKGRRAKLLGLDAPSKVDISVFVRERAIELGLNPDDAEREVRRSLRLVS